MEAAMSSLNLGHIFNPLDLEILDRVYEAAWAHIEARDLYRDPRCDPQKDGAREDALRKTVFTVAGTGPVDFDTLCDKVLASINVRPDA
jgi:hypothetical protein